MRKKITVIIIIIIILWNYLEIKSFKKFGLTVFSITLKALLCNSKNSVTLDCLKYFSTSCNVLMWSSDLIHGNYELITIG